ncbi:hypothetical protein [Rufibacter tibetensis]|uniref:Uncharacterized protein n=1 Tax=Rufibacter tibetensis TaxID=512763 RepID=A0A0P0CGT6_9BACT|nr:hypothetical protein [Rufibacter tibetensis]ALI98310.1 hypothetical protein DC20_04070 [Rufibacter tibetensis]
MEFNPPIKERETEDLLEIVCFPNSWQLEAVEQAKTELNKRGISLEEQLQWLEKYNWYLKVELRGEKRKRALMRYNPVELILMFFQLPGTILWDWNLKREGYLRMHKQWLRVIALSLFFYACIFLSIFTQKSKSDEAWLKEIQEQDISEWEKSYYGEVRDSTIKKKDSR